MTTTMVETTREGWGWVQSLAAARAQIYVEMASAWRRVRRFFFPKMLMAAAASLLVAGLVQQSPNVQVGQDVCTPTVDRPQPHLHSHPFLALSLSPEP